RAVSGVTDVQHSPLLLSLDAPFLSHQDRVEALFLTTLSRLPTDEERQVFVAHVAEQSDEVAARRAVADVLWALLNSAEFVLNH
ncbi:MAG: hypothetical protein AB7I37_27600, partial [Pirellulales bacterium]